MKFLLFLLLSALSGNIFAGISNAFADEPTIAGPWVQLYEAPKFLAKKKKLASVWGPNLPVGVKVKVVDIYGRWIFATPEPLKRMKKKDYAKAGWVYNRMLSLPGDRPIRSLSSRTTTSWINFHLFKNWKSIPGASNTKTLESAIFLESLVIGNATMHELRRLDEQASVRNSMIDELLASFDEWRAPALLPEAHAKPVSKENLGFSGAHLKFLRMDSYKAAAKRSKRQKEIESKRLKPPVFPPINRDMTNAIFGRYFFSLKAVTPKLSHEEVDAHLYLQSVAARALSGCSSSIQSYWKDRPWRFFRVHGFKNLNGAHDSSWFEFWLPGNYFVLSSEALREIKDEAELAFVLARQFVHIAKLKPQPLRFSKQWQSEMQSIQPVFERSLRKIRYVKHNERLDVGTEIASDLEATRCIASQDYHYGAGLKLVNRISANRHRPELENLINKTMGLDYRIKEFSRRLESELEKGNVRNSSILNEKRYRVAQKIWNL